MPPPRKVNNNKGFWVITKKSGLKKYAFTLAEILITLTILGIIAIITVPNIIKTYEDIVQIAQVKRAYSLIDNALQQMIAIEGPLNTWKWPGTENSGYNSENIDLFGKKLAQYLNAEKYCGTKLNSGCFSYLGEDGKDQKNTVFKTLSGNNNGKYIDNNSSTAGKMKLRNNMRVRIERIHGCSKQDPLSCSNSYGDILVDINGQKKPNRYGYDVFLIPIHPTEGVILKYRESSAFYDDCLAPNQTGRTCFAWVIKHNNMDYKRRDVSNEK